MTWQEAGNLVREEEFRNMMPASLNVIQQQLANISVQLDEANELLVQGITLNW
ncbi:TPA: hypothetical protein U1617_000003 [Streptococcus suis]|nr:hypothetical protein [Streptococcus suis]